MGWELIVVAAIFGVSLVIAVKAWANVKAADRELKCSHIWGMWETYRQGPINSGGQRIGQYAEQKRECTMCGEIRLREEQLYG